MSDPITPRWFVPSGAVGLNFKIHAIDSRWKRGDRASDNMYQARCGRILWAHSYVNTPPKMADWHTCATCFDRVAKVA